MRKKTNSTPVVAERITPAYPPRQVEKSPPCQASCPNCGDIRGWIGLVAQRAKLGLSREESYAQAWRTITDVNPFPSTLGRICPHPCESQCNRRDLDEPLAINALERFLGDFAIEAGFPLEPEPPQAIEGHWIGVIGAGPSGLSFAYQMARRGYRVTVYDARDQAGGMLRFGVPDYRLPQAVLDAEIQRILELGVELHMGVRVGRELSLEELQQRHDYLYLGIGAQRGLALNIPGAEGPGVMTGTDYLEKVNRGEAVEIGQRVVVIGGGNTAIDAARCARRGGAEVTLLYRRTRAEMPAHSEEIDDALAEQVELLELAAPRSIERDPQGRIEAIVAHKMELGEADKTGRRRPVPIEDSDFRLTADTIIMAVSQAPALEGLETLVEAHGKLQAGESGEVCDHVLAGGDALGLGIAGNAIVQGRRAAEALHAQLSGAPDRPTATGKTLPSDRIRLASKTASQATHKPTLEATDRVRLGMAEVSGNISEKQFLAEVERCFSCGSCFGCEQCFMYCTSGCFTRLEEPRPGMYFALNLDECKECGKCIEVCPCGFLEVAKDVETEV